MRVLRHHLDQPFRSERLAADVGRIRCAVCVGEKRVAGLQLRLCHLERNTWKQPERGPRVAERRPERAATDDHGLVVAAVDV